MSTRLATNIETKYTGSPISSETHSVLEALLKPCFKIKTNFSSQFLQTIFTYTEALVKKEFDIHVHNELSNASELHVS